MKKEFLSFCLSGEGAKIYGGRWNHKGIPIIYTAENRSLAVLETLVNSGNNELIPDHYLFIPMTVSSDLFDTRQILKKLPDDWRYNPAPLSCKDLGTQWIGQKKSLILEVPSAVIPYEKNFLFNPYHEDFEKIQMGEIEAYHFDGRLIKD